MGPNGLPVERYLGSCLISATARKHGPKQHYNGWPLISLGPRGGQAAKEQQHQQQRSPLSRLAIHTQGAPLILQTPYRKGPAGPPLQQQHHQRPQGHPVARKEPPKSPPVSDAASVASDESGHSENSLPRIIKPRKRRKKERKPSGGSESPPAAPQPSGQGAPVTLQPYVPLCYEQLDKLRQRRPPPPSAAPAAVLARNSCSGSEGGHALCQCNFCDPAGLILDVERLCHSPPPSLPPPQRVLKAAPAAPDYSELEVTSEIVTSLNGHRDIEIKFFSWKPPANEE
ncbi:cyclin-K [Cloeon dipterum]|uniref:cyclin-K n=1 Tax=Cloeon dipterum TaxID=197152 RepID=UPI00321FEBB8